MTCPFCGCSTTEPAFPSGKQCTHCGRSVDAQVEHEVGVRVYHYEDRIAELEAEKHRLLTRIYGLEAALHDRGLL